MGPMPGNRRVLAVEPTAAAAELVVDHLGRAGYLVEIVVRARDALRAILVDPPDLALVAATIPDADGLVLCGQVRRFSALPLILVVDQEREEDGLVALDHGVDDYVTRPLSGHALTAHVEAVLRRVERRLVGRAPRRLHAGQLDVDIDAREVRVDGYVVHLSPKEFAVLVHLMLHPRRPISAEELRDVVWGRDGSIRTVTVHVHSLRGKIERDPARPRHVTTVRGAGYQFEP